MKKKSFRSLVVALIVVMLILVPVMAVPKTAEAATTVPIRVKYLNVSTDVINTTNVYRRKEKLYALKRDKTLENLAMIRAAEIVYDFSHTCLNGKKATTLIRETMGNVYRGENIAVGQKNEAAVCTAWYKSTGHRKNMLNEHFTGIGVACVEIENTRNPKEKIRYWVQLFASSGYKKLKNQPEYGEQTVNLDVTSYTGFGLKGKKWYYFENGKVTNRKSSVIEGWVNGEYGWWNVKNSEVKFEKGFAQNSSGWWYIDESGRVTFKKNGVIYGTVNGINAWWNVKGSNVKFNNSVEQNEHGWWYIRNGKVDFGYTGLANNAHGWWYIKKGKLDWGYTGFCKHNNAWWYVQKGNLSFKYNGKVKGTINGKTDTYTVKGSKVIL